MSATYQDLINVPSFGKKRESDFKTERGQVTFWCKECKKIIQPIKLPPQKIEKKFREYLYECPDCHLTNIAIGTEEGIKTHYERK